MKTVILVLGNNQQDSRNFQFRFHGQRYQSFAAHDVFDVYYYIYFHRASVCCVEATYLASYRRETPRSIPTSTKKPHDIYGAIWQNILCLAAICAAVWFSRIVVLFYRVAYMRAWTVGRISYRLIKKLHTIILLHVQAGCMGSIDFESYLRGTINKQ